MEAKIDIEKVRKGDHAAFKTFFECFYPKLMALACRFVDEQVAKDLVQEVFTSYWEQKKVIQPDNIQSFLFKWLQNSCLNHIKHQMIVDEYESCVRIAEARIAFWGESTDSNDVLKSIIRKTKCFDFWERNVLFPKTKRSFFRTPKHPLPCPFPLNFSLLIITKKFGNLAKNRYICIV